MSDVRRMNDFELKEELNKTDRADDMYRYNRVKKEIERRYQMEHTTFLKVDFISSLKFWLAYLAVAILAFLIVAVIALVLYHYFSLTFVNFLSHFGLSVFSAV